MNESSLVDERTTLINPISSLVRVENNYSR